MAWIIDVPPIAAPCPELVEGRSLMARRRSMTGTRSRISRCLALTSQSIRADGKARLSAAATGIACTTSPSAPRRIRRKWCTGGSAARDARNEIARGVLLRIADDRRAASVRLHDRTLRHGVD